MTFKTNTVKYLSEQCLHKYTEAIVLSSLGQQIFETAE